jgi:hypothetical protein
VARAGREGRGGGKGAGEEEVREEGGREGGREEGRKERCSSSLACVETVYTVAHSPEKRRVKPGRIQGRKKRSKGESSLLVKVHRVGGEVRFLVLLGIPPVHLEEFDVLSARIRQGEMRLA